MPTLFDLYEALRPLLSRPAFALSEVSEAARTVRELLARFDDDDQARVPFDIVSQMLGRLELRLAGRDPVPGEADAPDAGRIVDFDPSRVDAESVFRMALDGLIRDLRRRSRAAPVTPLPQAEDDEPLH